MHGRISYDNMTIPKKYRRPVLIAVLFHAVLFLVLILSFAPSAFRAPPSSASMQTIQAKAIIEPNAAAQIAQQQAQEEHHEQQEKMAQKRQEQKMAEQKKEQKQALIEKEKAVAAAVAAKKQAQLKLALEQKQKAEKTAKLKQAQAQKKLMEARAQASAKLKVEAKKKLMEARATAKVKKELMEARAQATAAKKLQQELMQQQINSEAKNISAVVSQAQQGAIDKYKAAILSAIQSNWRIDQINSKLKCIYSVNLAPDGTVLSIQLMKSSGDSALDQSAQQAITLASPLPVPHNPVLFNHFRQLVLTLSPQGILQSVSSA